MFILLSLSSSHCLKLGLLSSLDFQLSYESEKKLILKADMTDKGIIVDYSNIVPWVKICFPFFLKENCVRYLTARPAVLEVIQEDSLASTDLVIFFFRNWKEGASYHQYNSSFADRETEGCQVTCS